MKLPESIGAGETGEGTLVLKKDNIDKSFNKSFTFELTDEKNSRFTVPVKRTIRKTSINDRKTDAKKVRGGK